MSHLKFSSYFCRRPQCHRRIGSWKWKLGPKPLGKDRFPPCIAQSSCPWNASSSATPHNWREGNDKSQYPVVHEPAPQPFLHAGAPEAVELVHLTGEQRQMPMGLTCFGACCGAWETMHLQQHRPKLSSPNCMLTRELAPP